MKPTTYIHTDDDEQDLQAISNYYAWQHEMERQEAQKKEARALVDDEQPTDRISF